MPVFDFKCQDCGHQFDFRVSNDEKKNVVCPQCGSKEIKQLLSAFYTSSSANKAPGPVPGPGCGGCSGCCGMPE